MGQTGKAERKAWLQHDNLVATAAEGSQVLTQLGMRNKAVLTLQAMRSLPHKTYTSNNLLCLMGILCKRRYYLLLKFASLSDLNINFI